jgi:type I restriction enzyme M protein
LINAVEADDKINEKEGFCRPEKRSLGNKRNKIEEYHIRRIVDLYTRFEVGPYSKIFDNEYFGYYQVVIEQPELDERGKPKMGRNGELKPDTKKRDKENIPLSEDIEIYFEKEVLPHIKQGWIDYDKTRIGYEINFSKYFAEFKPLRSTTDIKVDIHHLEFGKGDEKGIKDLIIELFK